MISRINNNSDLTIKLDRAINNATDIVLEYYTSGNYVYKATLAKGIIVVGDRLTIIIPSSELKKMDDGLLHCNASYAFHNEYYSD